MPDKSHLQATNGADRQKKTAHDPLKQGEGGASKTGPGIPQKGGQIPGNVPKGGTTQGDHLTPVRSHVAGPKTSERGGGGRQGHDRTNPNAGKAKSKDKNISRVI